MEKTCAFCGAKGPFTKEHVVPNFLYKKYKDHKLGYNLNAGKFVDGERIVKDVCGNCNNGQLGQLDEYGKQFLTENKNNQIRLAGEKYQISYDYGKLLRWLLKLSYNGIRSTNSYDYLISETIPYILGESQELPKTHLFFQLLRSYKLKDSDRDLVAEELPNVEYFPHFSFRFGRGMSNYPDSHLFSFRYIIFFDFCFYFLRFSKEIKKKHKIVKNITKLENVKDAVMLNKTQDKITVSVSSVTSFDMYMPQAERFTDAWAKHMKGQ
jgi:hypothetical protein